MSTRPNDDLIVALNSQVTHLIRRIRRVDERSGIGRARLSALAVLHFGGSCTLTELADAELVSTVTMHHVIKALEAEGMVMRRVDSNDRRRRRISLTKKGRRAIVRAHAARIEYLTILAAQCAPSDLAVTVRSLQKLNAAAKGIDEPL